MKYEWIILFLLVMLSCKKAEDRRCLKGAGEETTITVALDDFHEIFIGPNINVVLVQDSLNELHIFGGENLVNFISSDVEEGLLDLRNENKCNFLRSYKREITVEVHFTTLSQINFEGTKPLRCEKTITGNNLAVFVRDGAGLVDLDVAYNNISYTITNGWGNFDLSGTTGTLKMNIRSNGFGSTYNLDVSQQLDVVSNTAGLLKLNTEGADCRVQLQSVGDIWYIGTPNSLDVTTLDKGEWINKN